MTKRVGLTYKDSTNPLYCYDCGDYYEVINGGWSFDKQTGQIDGYKERTVEYQIIIPDMSDMKFDDLYNHACFTIIEEAEKIHAEVPEDIRGFICDGAGARDSSLMGAWSEITGGGG